MFSWCPLVTIVTVDTLFINFWFVFMRKNTLLFEVSIWNGLKNYSINIWNIFVHKLRAFSWISSCLNYFRLAANWLLKNGGRSRLLELRSMSHFEAQAFLLQIPGIGKKVTKFYFVLPYISNTFNDIINTDLFSWLKCIRWSANYLTSWLKQSNVPTTDLLQHPLISI